MRVPTPGGSYRIHGANASYVQRDRTMNVDARIARMDTWISQNKYSGRLSRREARDAQNTLNDIRRDYQYRAGDGRLSNRAVS